MPDGKLMTVAEVSRRLGVGKSFTYDLIQSGRLKYYQLGEGNGGKRVSERQLAEFLASRERGGALPEGVRHLLPEPGSPRRGAS